MRRHTSEAEVLREVEGDAIFYQKSGGGVIFSMGDPVAQPEFTIILLRLYKDAGIYIAR